MRHVIFILFSPIEKLGGEGDARCQIFILFCSRFPVQQTASGIGQRVNYFFRVGKQYAECEKQQPP